MGQTHSIDIRCLHKLQVLKHALLGHHTSRIGVVLVTIDATNLDRLAIDQQLSVTNGYRAETHLLRHAFNGFPVSVL